MVPESPMGRSHLSQRSAASGSSAGDNNGYMNEAAGLLAAAREQAQRLTPSRPGPGPGLGSGPQGPGSPGAKASPDRARSNRSVSSSETNDHVFRTTDESPDRAAKVLTILDSAER